VVAAAAAAAAVYEEPQQVLNPDLNLDSKAGVKKPHRYYRDGNSGGYSSNKKKLN
jgi:hypothetical protein